MKVTGTKTYPWILVICYSMLGLFFPASVTQFSMVVGFLAEALQVPQQTILLTDNVRAICLVCAMFLANYMYRKLGLRKTMALGMFLQIFPQLMIPITIRIGSLPALFLLKGMQGMNSMAFPLYLSTITLWISERYTGLATAIFNGSFAAGSGVGSWLVGRIIPAFGWEASFYVIGGICLAFAVPSLLLTRDKRCEKFPGSGTANNETLSQNRAQTENSTYASIIRQPVTWLLILALAANTWVTQAITVDMSVFASNMGYPSEMIGDMMLAISFMTVTSSILAGGVSDWAANKSRNSVKTRSWIMAAGYALSTVSAIFLPKAAGAGYTPMLLSSCSMMFGASWACGVFWALPTEVYSIEDHVSGTALCSSASNIPNPIATMIVGVVLGSNGHWTAGWLTCAVVSILSLTASVLLPRYSKNNRKDDAHGF